MNLESSGGYKLLNICISRKLNFLVFCLITFFFVAQPWHRDLGVGSFYLLSIVGLLNLRDFRLMSLAFRIIAISLIILLCVAFLSWYDSPYPDVHFRSIKSYALLLLTVPCYLAIKKSNLSLQQLCLALIGGAASLLLYAYLTYQTGFSGRWAGIENAVGFGNYTAILGALLTLPLFFHSVRQSQVLSSILVLASVFAFYVSYKSGTRSSVAVIAILGMFSILVLRRYMSTYAVLLIVASVLVGSVFLLAKSERFQKFDRDIVGYIDKGYYSGSFGQRLELWRLSACLANTYPLTGVGVGAFKSAQQDGSPTRCDVVINKSYYQAHSVYFQTLATMGYSGLFVLLSVFSSSLLFVRKKQLELKGLVAVPILSFMVTGLTVDLFFMDLVVARFALISAVLFAVSENNDTS